MARRRAHMLRGLGKHFVKTQQAPFGLAALGDRALAGALCNRGPAACFGFGLCHSPDEAGGEGRERQERYRNVREPEDHCRHRHRPHDHRKPVVENPGPFMIAQLRQHPANMTMS